MMLMNIDGGVDEIQCEEVDALVLTTSVDKGCTGIFMALGRTIPNEDSLPVGPVVSQYNV